MQHNNKKLELIITHEAYNDIDEIASFIALDNPTAAVATINMLLGACSELTRFPEIGIISPYIKHKNVRRLILKKRYIIVYRIDNNNIVVFKISNRYKNLANIL